MPRLDRCDGTAHAARVAGSLEAPLADEGTRRVSWLERATRTLSPEQQAMLEVWQRHVTAEFMTKRVEDALATVTEDA